MVLSRGSYSDYQENHYCIRANSPEEAKGLFKFYWKQIVTEDEYCPNLLFEDGEVFILDEEYDFYRWDVVISMLEVIHIKGLTFT